jgi:5-methylcytosine-specific restriction endonuclease McrA
MRTSRKETLRSYDKQRNDDPHWRFLRSREWREIRRAHLQREPLCRHCKLSGKVQLAAEVDHIQHPNGDWDLARDPANFQSLCKPHHTKKTRGRALEGCTADGRPVDPSHPWNAARGEG